MNDPHIVLENLASLLLIDPVNLLQLPCYVFSKDLEGVYSSYNDYGAKNLGYKAGNDIIGKKDFAIFPEEMADNYRSNDKTVISSNKSLFVPEKGVLKDSCPIVFLSYKMPLYNENKKIIGIMGISFTRPTCEINFSTTDQTAQALAEACNYCPDTHKFNCSTLSKQEKICLFYLSKGYTLKMIAKKLNISPKTIETYLERIKNKTNFETKAQLITAFSKSCQCKIDDIEKC